jgi:hypothetical protein
VDTHNTPQFKTKTTVNSRSDLRLTASRDDWLGLRVARVGKMLYRFACGSWRLSRCFERPDMPATFQVGVNAFTDWGPITGGFSGNESAVNRTLLTRPDTHPDLVVRGDYIHFARPPVPDDVKAHIQTGGATVKDRIGDVTL